MGTFHRRRIFGVRVDVFSIGFGHAFVWLEERDTDYRVSALPLGGYVSMAGQDLSEVDSSDKPPNGAPDELMSKPRWQRALISFAGPAVNIDFSDLSGLTGLFTYVGIPYAAYLDNPVMIAALSPSLAAKSRT